MESAVAEPGLLCLQERAQASENKAIIRRLVEEGMNKDRLDLFDETYSQAYIERRGVQGFKEQSAQTRAAFPDYGYTIDDIVAEDDKVSVRWTMRGTHLGEYQGIPATGRAVTLTGMHMFQLDAAGKIEEMWSQASRETLLQQLI
ncbi:MAG TPA: ester cyclase [Chloroflexia bacterium]|nr:ester cyclase [Chloroflexia bacterium]